MVLMVTDAFYLDVLPIQPETGIVIETDGPETASGFSFVRYSTVLFDHCFDFIKGGTVR